MHLVRRLALALVLVLAAGEAAVAQRAVSGEPVEIPCLLSLTGPFALVGKKSARTFQVVEKIVNATGGIQGRPLHFAVNDIGSNPTVAVQVVNQILATRRPPVIMGPEPGAAVLAIQPLTKNDTVLYVIAASIHPPPGSYTFGNELSTEFLTVASIRYLHKRGFTKIGILATTDVTGQDQIDQIVSTLRLPEMAGTTVVGTERQAFTDISVTSQLARLRAAGADVVFAGVAGLGFGTVLHGITDLGWDVPVMTAAGNLVREQIDQYKSFMPKEVYFVGPRFMSYSIAPRGPVKDAQARFYEAMRSEGVTRPDWVDAVVWDPAWVVVSGLRKFGPAMSAAQLHDYIEGLHGFAGMNGILDYRDGNQRGVGINAILVLKWDAGRDDWLPVSELGGNPRK
jgi:branched-chain amino acid transport system substrate-binding protein